MAIVLFDTEKRMGLYPLTYTRAMAELRMGICTVQERWQHLLNEDVYIETAPYLQPLYGKAPAGVHTFIDAQVIPSDDLINSIKGLQQGEVLEDETGVIACKAIKLRIARLVGSAIAWNTSRLIVSLFSIATNQLQIYVQLFGCARIFV